MTAIPAGYQPPTPSTDEDCWWCGSREHSTGRHQLPDDPDDREALSALRDMLAFREAARRNGIAGDGHGWFRNDEDQADCYRVAASMLPLFEARWEYGTRLVDRVMPADDREHAEELRAAFGIDRPVVRQLFARHCGDWQPAA